MIILRNYNRRTAFQRLRQTMLVVMDGLLYKVESGRWEYHPTDCVDRTVRHYLPYRWRTYDPDGWSDFGTEPGFEASRPVGFGSVDDIDPPWISPDPPTEQADTITEWRVFEREPEEPELQEQDIQRLYQRMAEEIYINNDD